jgi:hypothetical protein
MKEETDIRGRGQAREEKARLYNNPLIGNVSGQ